MSEPLEQGLRPRDWQLLLRRIKQGKCTPFIGAGACHGVLPLGHNIAKKWARDFQYPLQDSHDLARVAQFMAVGYDSMFPKEQVIQEFIEGADPPVFAETDEPHAVLAELPLPIYLTTNYDDFMTQALQHRQRNARQALCQWNPLIDQEQGAGLGEGFRPSAQEPIVYHLHGHKGSLESLVLTEDDYLDFLVNVTKDPEVLPHLIRRALTNTSLLFIGYSLEDWDFRVLFRGLVTSTDRSLRRISITVQLPRISEDATEAERREMRGYLNKYFGKQEMRVYWGTAREFAAELRERWEAFTDGR